MIRTATPADLPHIIELLRDANDAPYDVARVAEEKCFGVGVSGEPEVRIHGDFDGLAVRCGRYLRLLAVAREARGRGVGRALVAHAEARGATVIAAEPGNYFTPGVPEPLVPFFASLGFRETASTHNLICSTNVAAPPAPRRPRADEREHVLGWIEQHFGRIWRFEASRAFDADPPTIVYLNDAGFAAHDANNRGLGFFGPTGVAESLRGRGHGRDLLLASLADLRRLGYDEAVIPWTDAIRFYEKSCGARIAHRFVTMAK